MATAPDDRLGRPSDQDSTTRLLQHALTCASALAGLTLLTLFSAAVFDVDLDPMWDGVDRLQGILIALGFPAALAAVWQVLKTRTQGRNTEIATRQELPTQIEDLRQELLGVVQQALAAPPSGGRPAPPDTGGLTPVSYMPVAGPAEATATGAALQPVWPETAAGQDQPAMTTGALRQVPWPEPYQR